MSTLVLTIIAAVVAVAIFILGMSLTQLIKGHPIRSEIADNPHMQKLGIKCASQQMREEERALRGEYPYDPLGCGTDTCGTCSTHNHSNE